MYLEYHELLKKYKETSQEFYKALDDGSKIAIAVTLKSSQFKEIVVNESNSPSDTKLINYIEKRAELDEIINKTRNDMNILEYYLKKMALEMEKSNDVCDRIYYYKWIKHLSPYKFYKIIGYTPRQIYRIIREMNKELYPKR